MARFVCVVAGFVAKLANVCVTQQLESLLSAVCTGPQNRHRGIKSKRHILFISRVEFTDGIYVRLGGGGVLMDPARRRTGLRRTGMTASVCARAPPLFLSARFPFSYVQRLSNGVGRRKDTALARWRSTTGAD